MGYRTLFEVSGIHHSNTGLQITHDMYINGFFMIPLLWHRIMRRLRLIHHSLRMEISGSNYSLADSCRNPSLACCTSNTTVLFLINFSRSHDQFPMEPWQILCTLRDVTSFLDLFLSNLVPSSRSILKHCTLIVNADPHKERGSHWLAIRLTPRCSSA